MKALLCKNKLNRMSAIGVSYSSIERYAAVNIYIRRKEMDLGWPPGTISLHRPQLENVLHCERHLAIASAEDLTV